MSEGSYAFNRGVSDTAFCIAACENCGQHIEFPAEGIGLKVSCPHCACDTTLHPENPPEPERIKAGISAGE